jgi:7-keto-8-aminopelargonate synthetase-like enzyme
LSAIIPFHVGNEAKAMTLAATLRDHGLFVPAVRFPTVARGAARFDVSHLFTALKTAGCEFKTAD